MPKVDDKENGYANISGQKRRYTPVFGPEDIEAVDEGQDNEADNGKVRTPWLHYRRVREVGNTLYLAGFAKSKIDD